MSKNIAGNVEIDANGNITVSNGSQRIKFGGVSPIGISTSPVAVSGVIGGPACAVYGHSHAVPMFEAHDCEERKILYERDKRFNRRIYSDLIPQLAWLTFQEVLDMPFGTSVDLCYIDHDDRIILSKAYKSGEPLYSGRQEIVFRLEAIPKWDWENKNKEDLHFPKDYGAWIQRCETDYGRVLSRDMWLVRYRS